METDQAIRKRVFQGRIPLAITLAPEEQDAGTEKDPFYVGNLARGICVVLEENGSEPGLTGADLFSLRYWLHAWGTYPCLAISSDGIIK
jgi:hypothetical protein